MSTPPFAPPTEAPSPEPPAPSSAVSTPEVAAPVFPTPGESIISLLTGSTYKIGEPIGQGAFGIVYACVDDWNNELAAKVLKPTKSPQEMQAAALVEKRDSSNFVTRRLPTSTTPSSIAASATSSPNDAAYR